MLEAKPMIQQRIYLDHNATTPLADEIKTEIIAHLETFGNPSSIHWAGQKARGILRESREALASVLKVNPLEVIFTSGASESNATVIRGVFDSIQSERCEFITTQIEHPSVLKMFAQLELRGAKVHYVPVSRQGKFDFDFFDSVLSERTALVSVMAANNETGLILPLKEISEKAHFFGALVHSDCVQALAKIPLKLSELNLDFASFSAHKVNGLKGTGALFIKKGTGAFTPLIHGGGQERKRRGGTENTLGILSLGLAAQRIEKSLALQSELQKLRDSFETKIVDLIRNVEINQIQGPRLSNTSSLIISGVDGETLLMALDLKGFAVSTGAACSSGNPEPSPVLLGMGLSRAEAQSSLRVSFGLGNTEEQINAFTQTLVSVVDRLRSIQREVSL